MSYKQIENQKEEIHEKNEELEQQKEELQITLENLKQTQKQLVESEKMASLGNLVAGIAHEINTPLGVGLAASSSLLSKTKEISKSFENKSMTHEDLLRFLSVSNQASELIFNNLERTGDLVKSFKQVSVDQTSETKRDFLICQYIKDIITSLKPKYKNKPIKFSVKGNEELHINSYPGAFAQILTNLIINSIQHGFTDNKEGKIIISSYKEDNWLIIKYNDNGIGISEKYLSKIFDPFFTTDMSKGSGLGLHIIYNLITQKLNGTVNCKSEVGKGTEFIISFPFDIK